MEEIKNTYTNTDKKDMTSKSRIPVTNTLFIKKIFSLFIFYLFILSLLFYFAQLW